MMQKGSTRLFRIPTHIWLLAAIVVVASVITFRSGAEYMWQVWQNNDEYSYAYLVPFISLFLIWQQKNALAALEFQGSWAGVLVALGGITLGFLGQLAAVYTLQQIGLVVTIWGAVLAVTGWPALRLLWMPLLLLLFMVPLPRFLQVNLSSAMQLWSSAIGVEFIRLMGISVYLEGNVIDLGTYQLQVVEACDGLRYLFPLMTLSLIMAFFFQAPFWKRLVLFASSVPIAILMNSLRVAMIGWLVEHWGVRMAEGFLHEFQGWAVFMLSLGVMALVMVALSRIGKDRRPWRETFGLQFPGPSPRDAPYAVRRLTASGHVACIAVVAAALTSLLPSERIEAVPSRAMFLDFPMTIGPWLGKRRAIEPEVIQKLQFNDYVVADYTGSTAAAVNLYVAWYDSQRSGRSVHSPRTCLPGGGWKVVEFDQVEVPRVMVAGRPLRANRALMTMGEDQLLVYYWFQQRGRIITNEYAAKAYLFWDSLTRNRTDGALVRLMVVVPGGAVSHAGDGQLARFANDLMPVLGNMFRSDHGCGRQ